MMLCGLSHRAQSGQVHSSREREDAAMWFNKGHQTGRSALSSWIRAQSHDVEEFVKENEDLRDLVQKSVADRHKLFDNDF